MHLSIAIQTKISTRTMMTITPPTVADATTNDSNKNAINISMDNKIIY